MKVLEPKTGHHNSLSSLVVEVSIELLVSVAIFFIMICIQSVLSGLIFAYESSMCFNIDDLDWSILFSLIFFPSELKLFCSLRTPTTFVWTQLSCQLLLALALIMLMQVEPSSCPAPVGKSMTTHISAAHINGIATGLQVYTLEGCFLSHLYSQRMGWHSVIYAMTSYNSGLEGI